MAIYFREPTPEEREAAGTDEPFMVYDRERTETSIKADKAFSDMFKESRDAFNKLMEETFI